jgi:hypothetical protein
MLVLPETSPVAVTIRQLLFLPDDFLQKVDVMQITTMAKNDKNLRVFIK